MKALLTSIFILFTMFAHPLIAKENDHDHGAHQASHDEHETDGSHEEAGVVELSPEQVKQIGLKVETVKLQPRPNVIRAPGTVAFNAYRLADVTTLIGGVVRARHVRLGDEVKKGQKLLTLISPALAQAEAGYLKAEAEHRKSRHEWKRLEGLAAQKIVSLARLQQAEGAHQAAHANLTAARAILSSYGLSRKDIDSLANQRDFGQLSIRAPSSGTVVADNFRIGQHLSAGTLLLQIADETTVWIEVQIPESKLAIIRVGLSASVTTKGDKHRYTGKVVNIHHQLDPVTRTAGVRLEINNPEDALHPGMFVQAEIAAGMGKPALLLPELAVQRQGNELIVFVEEEPGHYERREVRVGQASMELIPILDGLRPGERVVTKGAFILLSELAKSGFEVHQH